MKKQYKVDILSVKSIEKLQEQLAEYKETLLLKTEEFAEKLAEIGIPVIDEKMAAASFTVDEKGVRSGSDTSHSTYVKLENAGAITRAVLTVEGNELLFIEFGAGVKYNGAVGSSPHPWGGELGYTIGGYGEGHGKQNTWGYIDEGGELVLTHGTEATMPLYNATLKIINDYKSVAKEVFG